MVGRCGSRRLAGIERLVIDEFGRAGLERAAADDVSPGEDGWTEADPVRLYYLGSGTPRRLEIYKVERAALDTEILGGAEHLALRQAGAPAVAPGGHVLGGGGRRW